jgi:hypothetical protein
LWIAKVQSSFANPLPIAYDWVSFGTFGSSMRWTENIFLKQFYSTLFTSKRRDSTLALAKNEILAIRVRARHHTTSYVVKANVMDDMIHA